MIEIALSQYLVLSTGGGGLGVELYRGTATGKVTYSKYYPAGDYILRLYHNRQRYVTSCTTSFTFFYNDGSSEECFYKDDWPNPNLDNAATADFNLTISKSWNSYQIVMSVTSSGGVYCYMNLRVDNLRNY